MCIRAGAPPQVFVWKAKLIQEKGYPTLFTYMTRKPNSLVSRIVLGWPPAVQVRALARMCALCCRYDARARSLVTSRGAGLAARAAGSLPLRMCVCMRACRCAACARCPPHR